MAGNSSGAYLIVSSPLSPDAKDPSYATIQVGVAMLWLPKGTCLSSIHPIVQSAVCVGYRKSMSERIGRRHTRFKPGLMDDDCSISANVSSAAVNFGSRSPFLTFYTGPVRSSLSHAPCDLNFIVKGKGLLEVPGSHVLWKSCNISETVLDRDVVTRGH